MYIMRHAFSKAVLIIGVFAIFALARNVFGQTATPTPTPTPTPTSTQDKSAKQQELQKKIDELQQKVTELQSQAKSLSTQIGVIDSQISLSELKIANAQEKIKNLKDDILITKEKVLGAESDIDKTAQALMGRVEAVYEVGSVDPWQVLLTSNNLDNFFTRLKYLKVVQLYDKKNVFAAEQAKVNYEAQQQILVEKQKEEERLNEELQQFNEQLNSEKLAKKRLLDETKGSEANYQKLLSQARAEYAAIQGIIAGNGAEVEVGKVSTGQTIASVIPGPSCNSSGAHLHFIVRQGNSTVDPFNYLKSVDHENCSGSSCGSGDGDSFNPVGDWDWPVDPKIKMNQGYGQTWAVRNTWAGQVYSFHNGLDITGSSFTVKAVKSGILYQGSYGGSGGCRLPYVRVKHDEGGLDTLYLHVNY